MAAAGFVLVTVVAALAVYGSAHLLGFHDFRLGVKTINAGILLATNLGLGLLVPMAGGLSWLLYRVRPRWVSSVSPRLRWHWLFTSLGMAAGVWGIFFVLGVVAAASARTGAVNASVVGLIVVIVLTIPLQAAGEEYLFRGFVLQSLGATRLPTWMCCLLSAALFATAHGQFAPPLFADRLLLGSVLAWLAVRTGGLEAGIAIHLVKNVAVLIPAALLGRTTAALQPTAVTWIPLGLDAVLLAIVVWWVCRVAARRLPTTVAHGSVAEATVGGQVADDTAGEGLVEQRRPDSGLGTRW